MTTRKYETPCRRCVHGVKPDRDWVVCSPCLSDSVRSRLPLDSVSAYRRFEPATPDETPTKPSNPRGCLLASILAALCWAAITWFAVWVLPC